MRVLVCADDDTLRAARVAALGPIEVDAVVACDIARLAYETRRSAPDVLLLEGLETASAVRDALRRAREALERPLAALLFLPAGHLWLRAPLPPDLQPAVAVRSADLADTALSRAFERLLADRGVPPLGTVARYGITLDRAALEVSTDYGRVRLTPSEATVLDALMSQPARVVPHQELARALFGRVLADPGTRATIRGHIATLRQKLAELEAEEQVEGLRGVGYRFVEPARRRPPPRR